MKEEIDGGTFASKNEEASVKQEPENKFISGEPSMITTDEVFALLGEQMIRAKNWSKIALAWNRNFNALKQSISQRELQIVSMSKQNQDFKESNSKYVIANQTLDKRITDLNIQIKEGNTKFALSDEACSRLNTKYKELEKQNQELKTKEEGLIKEILYYKNIKEEDEKEKAILKEKIAAREKRKAKKSTQ